MDAGFLIRGKTKCSSILKIFVLLMIQCDTRGLLKNDRFESQQK